ncbi:VIT1/CCC1 transporter family protein [Sphingomonas sp. R86520]|uniref:VIT1/CCC1 transporter family protein n=1 Tax=Sphingomonas sp. R86520 TaxID=3093859 RepID=UPI0036D356A5
MRAALLGANDESVSTASLVIGVAAAFAHTAGETSAIVIPATVGVVAGAMSMAVAEHVSISAHADTETAQFASDELNAPSDSRARPLRTPFALAASVAAGAALPLLTVLVASPSKLVCLVAAQPCCSSDRSAPQCEEGRAIGRLIGEATRSTAPGRQPLSATPFDRILL